MPRERANDAAVSDILRGKRATSQLLELDQCGIAGVYVPN